MGHLMARLSGGVKKLRRSETRWGSYLIAVVLIIYAVAPLVIFASNALKTRTQIAQNPIGLPTTWEWSNFATAWNQADMGRGLINSGIIAVSTAIGVAVIASMAAYAMTRLNLPAKGGWMVFLLVSTSLPIQLFLVPLVSWWSAIGLYDSQFGLIVIYWALYSPFATLLVRSFLIGMPKDQEEAARIDGAGEFAVFARVVAPMIWPGILTAALVSGLQADNDVVFVHDAEAETRFVADGFGIARLPVMYNEFLLAVTFIQDGERLPASLSLYMFQQSFTTDWSMVSAAGLIMALPAIVFFILLQRRFIEGYASGGLAN